jgi:hypothetical protein
MGDLITGDWAGAPGTQHLLLAETIGLAMARRAADILDRHRAALASGADTGAATAATAATASDVADVADVAAAADVAADDDADDEQFAADNAIFTAVLDATNECLGRFDGRPADDRWCDALFQLIQLATLAKPPVQAG